MRKNIKNRRKRKIKLALLSLLLFIGIGYALTVTSLKINGLVSIPDPEWDVHFENVSETLGSVTAVTQPTSDDETTTEMTYAINLTTPGDFYEFTVDIVNEGNIDAMVEEISNTVYEADGTTERSLPAYLKSTITYSDGVQIKQNQILAHDTSEKIKVRVEFRQDINPSDLPSTAAETVKFKFIGQYRQANSTVKPVRIEADFATDSWDKIIESYEIGTITHLREDMENGTTREVELDLDFDGTPETTAHLRIANLSECENGETSETTCGLVLEFADMISVHRFNKLDDSGYSNGDGNKGGWKYSDMRAYLNGGIYLEGNQTYEVDYTNAGVIDALPSDLKSKIIPTIVVSGYGTRDSSNFTTTDYLYLLSTKEIYGTAHNLDTVKGTENNPITRQLDYYKHIGVTLTNYSGASKQYSNGDSSWYLRSAFSNYYNSFFRLYPNGEPTFNNANSSHGVSPAFRIASNS